LDGREGKAGERRGEIYNGHERKAENRTYSIARPKGAGTVYESVSKPTFIAHCHT